MAYPLLPTKKTFQTFLGTLALVAASTGFAYWFYLQIAGIEADSRAHEIEIATLEKKSQEVALAKKNLEEHRENIKHLQDSFLSEENFVAFLTLLEGLGRQSGTAFHATAADIAKDGRPARITFEVTGSYDALIEFFVLLEHVPFHVFVENVSLQPTASGIRAGGTLVVFNTKATQ